MGVGSSSKAYATIAIVVDDRRAISAITTLRSKFQSFGRDLSKSFGGAAKKAGSFLARSLDPLGRGFAIIGDAVGEVMDYEKGIARTAIAQGRSNESMAGFRAQLTAVSKATGVNRNEVLRGVQAYQSLSGDTEHAAEVASTLARVSQATGTDIGDVAKAADSLRTAFGADSSSLEGFFDILITQGKAGKIELNELAGIIPDVAGQFGQFAGGKTKTGMAEMNAGLQVMKEKFGSSEKAATGFNALQTQLVKKAKEFKKHKIEIYDKTGKMREFSKIVDDIGNSKIFNDKTALSGLFGSTEAYRGFLALQEGAGLFNQLKDTRGSQGATGRDLKQYKDSSAGKMEVAINDLKLAILEALTPERIKKVAEGMGMVANALGTVAGGVESFLDGAAAVGRAWLGDHRPAEGRDEATLTKRRYEQLAEIRGLDTSGSAEDIRWRLENLENGKGASINSAGGVQAQLQRARDKLAQVKAAEALMQSVGMGRSAAPYADVRAADKLVRSSGTGGGAYYEKEAAAALVSSAKHDLETAGTIKSAGGVAQAFAAAGGAGSVDPQIYAREFSRALADEIQKAWSGITINLDGSKVGEGVANSTGGSRRL